MELQALKASTANRPPPPALGPLDTETAALLQRGRGVVAGAREHGCYALAMCAHLEVLKILGTSSPPPAVGAAAGVAAGAAAGEASGAASYMTGDGERDELTLEAHIEMADIYRHHSSPPSPPLIAPDGTR